MKNSILKLSILVLFIGMSGAGITYSYYSDTETSVGNTLTAGTWDSNVVPTDTAIPSATPTPTPTITPTIINTNTDNVG